MSLTNAMTYSALTHVVTSKNDIQLWHRWMSHPDHDIIAALHKTTTGLPQINKVHVERCADCLLGKIKRLPFPRKLSRGATQPLDIVYVDLCDPMPVISIGRNKYSMIFTDDWSHWRDVSFFVKKSDTVWAFIPFKARVERFHLKRGYKQMIVQHDQCELTSNDLMDELALEGVKSNLMTRYTPQDDGVAEASNRITVNDTNTMIKSINCSKSFCVTAMTMAVYLQNCVTLKAIRIATVSTNRKMTLDELWCGQKPNIRHLRFWSCIAYVMVPKERC